MSTALAIAGVTATLRKLLDDSFVRNDLNGLLGKTVAVTALPPDVITTGPSEGPQLNVFLRQVTPNAAWRNAGLPAYEGRQRTSNPPLALNLHYLFSAYGGAPLHPEILLGHTMQILHEHPLLTREDLRTALDPTPPVTALELALAESGLEKQLESLRIAPEFLSTEETSKFWTATLARYRQCVAYVVSVVLIEAREPSRNPLPVLTRELRPRPAVPLLPTLVRVVPADGEPAALLGSTVQLIGHQLGGSDQEVRLESDRFDVAVALIPSASTDDTLDFELPENLAASLPVGVYRVFARLPTATGTQETNRLALVVAPKVTSPPPTPLLVRDADGSASLTVQFVPALRAGQRASLFVGSREAAPAPFTVDPNDPPTELTFILTDAPAGTHFIRLRIDGVDSPVVDRTSDPPVFRDHQVTI